MRLGARATRDRDTTEAENHADREDQREDREAAVASEPTATGGRQSVRRVNGLLGSRAGQVQRELREGAGDDLGGLAGGGGADREGDAAGVSRVDLDEPGAVRDVGGADLVAVLVPGGDGGAVSGGFAVKLGASGFLLYSSL